MEEIFHSASLRSNETELLLLRERIIVPNTPTSSPPAQHLVQLQQQMQVLCVWEDVSAFGSEAEIFLKTQHVIFIFFRVTQILF